MKTQALFSPDESPSKKQEFIQSFTQLPREARREEFHLGLAPLEMESQLLQMELSLPRNFWITKNEKGDSLARVGANLSPTYLKTGYLGFFEAKDFGAAKTVMEEALLWLKNNGVQKVYGPVNWNTWLAYRFRIQEKPEETSFAWEPINPPEYPLWFEELGFQTASHYHTDGLDGLDGILEKTKKDYDRVIDNGYEIRPFDSKNLLSVEVPRLYELSMSSFEKNFLFEKVAFEFFRQLYVPIANKADVSLSRMVFDRNDKPVAFFFHFQEGKSLVSKSVGVLPEARGKGISNAALYSSVKEALARGLSDSIMALMRSGIQSESYGKKQNLQWRHHYVLFEKEL